MFGVNTTRAGRATRGAGDRSASVAAALTLLLVAVAVTASAVGQAAPSILLTGDVFLGGPVGDLIENEGPAVPFAGVAHVLRQADVVIGNLECPLATTGRPVAKRFTFCARPAAAPALAAGGFDIVSLANNHSVDYGPGALMATIGVLHQHGVMHVGAGQTSNEARRGILIECGSPPLTIAVLAFSNMLPSSFYATGRRPGTNPARPRLVRETVASARARADAVIVVFHWGDELSPTPTKIQRHLAAAAADSGADLVVGHHPHVLQGMEIRGHTLIAYSLGNFLFPASGRCGQTIILRYSPTHDGGARVQFIPCVIDGFCPRIAGEAERAEILSQLERLSDELNSKLSLGRGTIVLAPRPLSVDRADPAP